jgi:hypothetical protein
VSADRSTKTRPSLLQRTLGVFVLLALSLGGFLWAGKSLVQRPVENVYLDSQRLGALRSFERAIVPLKSVANYEEPTPDLIRARFAFCSDRLKEQPGAPVTARAKRLNPCAHGSAAEELACHLKIINAKLHEMGDGRRKDREQLLAERYVVSLDSWAEAIRGTEPQAKQTVSCRDAVAAARQMAAGEGRLLGLLAWRERSPKSVAASQFPDGQAVKVSGRILEQRNPWGGVPGCVYYGEGAKLAFVTDRRQSNRQACLAMRPRDADEKSVTPVQAADAPESLDVILADLDNVRLPWRDLYRAYTEAGTEEATEKGGEKQGAQIRIAATHGPNQLERQKHKVDAGFNVHLTIDPDAQRLVQQTSLCYAGDAASCQRLGLDKDAKFSEFTGLMYERAAVRMAAVALIDVPSGRIEALGSARSDCYRQEYDGPGRKAKECPDLPSTPHYEPDRLLNHALYTDALPGSLVKPIMATGFLRDPAYRKKILGERVANGFVRLQDELKGSDSVAFLNRMFCIDKGWTNCERPREIQNAALQFGWDAGCQEPSFRCGRMNVLFGYPDSSRIRADTARMPLGASVMYGRILVEPPSPKRAADQQLMSNFHFEPAHAASCSRGEHYSGTAEKRGWRKCKQGRLLYIESEGWGQGNARTTALGAAGMIARLAAAANGQASQRLPYLVERISDAQAQKFELAAQQFRLADAVPLEIPRDDALLIVQGMVSHKAAGAPAGSRSGTAHSACARVLDTATCNRIDWIAGKTGTPPYGNDGLTLKEIKAKCGAAPGEKASFGEKQEWWTSCSREQPYKWYIAAFRTDDTQPGFNKAIAVLTERNWYRAGTHAGKVQAPGDREMNVSAELAFRIMGRMRSIQAEKLARAPATGGPL